MPERPRALARSDPEYPRGFDALRRPPDPLYVAGRLPRGRAAAALYLAGGVFLGQRGSTEIAGALPVRLSMAGFDPKVITVKAGAEVNLDFWNQDNAMHLDGGGVHTFIMPEYQNIYVKIPAEARQAFTFTAPSAPGDYDFYCDTCCGGKESPTMHGTLRVEAA